MARALTGLAAALLLAAPGRGLPWGEAGHRIAAAVAEARLSPAARRLVQGIAGDLPLSSPQIATWADAQRDPATRPWHYVNIPFSSGRYLPARDCPREACAVAAIARAQAVLSRAGASPAERGQALRWLVHLVADLHQPLHAGDGRDRGGNDLRVRIRQRRQPTNLHRVWDADVVAPLARGLGAEEAARALLAKVPVEQARAWAASLDPAAWAEESSRESRAIYAELGREPGDGALERLRPWVYEQAQRPRVEAALARAGVRLAAALDRLAGGDGSAP